MQWASRENGEEEAVNKNAGPTGTRTHCMSWVLGLVDIEIREFGQGWRVAGMGKLGVGGDGMGGRCMQCSKDGGRAMRRAGAVLF